MLKYIKISLLNCVLLTGNVGAHAQNGILLMALVLLFLFVSFRQTLKIKQST